jgi:hypothetical protein
VINLIFEYYIRVRIFPEGRVSITFNPLPFAVGKFVNIDEAIKILEREKEKFNREINYILRVLRRIKEEQEKWK